MSFVDKAHGRLTEAFNALIVRRKQTSDENERAAIDNAINQLNDILTVLVGAALYNAAASVVEATLALEGVVAAARLGPFDDFLAMLESPLERIGALLRQEEIGEQLDRTPDVPEVSTTPQTPSPEPLTSSGTQPPEPSGAPPAVSDPSSPSAPQGPLPPITPSLNLGVILPEYEAWFAAMKVRPEHRPKVDWHVERLLRQRDKYQAVGSGVNNVPWAVVGVIHAMECGFSFVGHLHNGDPLTGRTKRVPAGRPKTGNPPFSWEESAVDALNYEGFGAVTNWSIPRMLYQLEKYNGFGYRNKSLPTPYLWSFSNLYEKGKYVADGRYDPEHVSKQCGAAVMLKALVERGISLT